MKIYVLNYTKVHATNEKWGNPLITCDLESAKKAKEEMEKKIQKKDYWKVEMNEYEIKTQGKNFCTINTAITKKEEPL